MNLYIINTIIHTILMSRNTKMIINSYFSDDEVEEEQLEEEDYESDESLDEETRKIVFNTVAKSFTDFEIEKTVKVEKPKDKPKTKSTVSLEEFVKKSDETKPKKFISKRADEKKKSTGVELLYKRQFTPRFPPYNQVYKKEANSNINIDSSKEFPSLK